MNLTELNHHRLKPVVVQLILKDEDELVNTELERIPFNIDLVFGGAIQF